jgi:hypothetical protein
MQLGAAMVAFLVTAGVGLTAVAGPDGRPLEATTAVLALALAVGFVTAAAVERRLQGDLHALRSQVLGRSLLLVVAGIGLDVALASGAARGLGMPLAMDAVGTILVGVLCGPLAGALTGAAAALVTGALPEPLGIAGAGLFAPVGAMTGILAGVVGGNGVLRPRPGARIRALLGSLGALAIVAVPLALNAWAVWPELSDVPLLATEGAGGPATALGWIASFVAVGALVGGAWRLVLERDAAVPLVVAAGMLIGIATALARWLLAGAVAGSAAPLAVAPVADALAATAGVRDALLGALLLVEPVDRAIATLAAFVAITAIPVTTRDRFPQGAALVADDDDFALRVRGSMRASR